MDVQQIIGDALKHGALLVPIIIALVAILKTSLVPEAQKAKVIPPVAVLLGIGGEFAVDSGNIYVRITLTGIVIGLMACGLWTGGKSAVEKRLKPPTKNPSGHAGMKAIAMLLIFSLLALSGCATSKATTAAKGLVAMKETVIGIAEAADKLCAQGYLTQDECDKVKDIYGKTTVSWDLANDALVVAIKLKDAEGAWDKYLVFHGKFLDLYKDIYGVAVNFKLLK